MTTSLPLIGTVLLCTSASFIAWFMKLYVVQTTCVTCTVVRQRVLVNVTVMVLLCHSNESD